MKCPLSVFIITKNEEARIAQTIEAVIHWVHEVIVVDSGSNDATTDIAKALGAKVYHNDWQGYGPQKRFAEDQCSQEWWFNLDADEVVSDQLRQEITALFQTSPLLPAAYKMPILYIYPGDDKPRPFANDYNVVRLYHKSTGRYRDHPVYDRVVINAAAPIKQLTASVNHHAFLNWSQLLEKANASADNNLDKLISRPRWQLILRIFFGFPLNLLRNYIMRRHIFGGWKGFIFALATTFSRTLRIAKALAKKEEISQ